MREPSAVNAVVSEPMPIVMKFGGSSVADLERLRTIAGVIAARAKQQPVVVVVSAMGKTTDRLITDARTVCDPPASRELDMLLTTGERTSMALLALALQGLGQPAISLTGSQCGVISDHQHGRARIVEVRPFRILDELAIGNVVVVGGFQGVSYKRDVTTLGRGGSDTTAVALAAALGADCEIYSDVDGIYDGDPRKVDDAQRIAELGYEEMQALARAGAKVLHGRAVELASERGIAIYARASASTSAASGEAAGETVIRLNPAKPTGVRAVACDPDVVDLRVRLSGPSSTATIARLLELAADIGVRYLTIDELGLRGLLSNTQRDDLRAMQTRLGTRMAALEIPLDALEWRGGLALVSLIGTGLEERPETITRTQTLLDQAGIAILGVKTDSNSIAVLVESSSAEPATRALHAGMLRAG
jgi:aspartate kinase